MSLAGLPLILASVGDCVTVTSIAGGKAMQKRLQDLGILVGKELRIVHKEDRSALVVAVGDTRFALGQGMAQKIFVSPPGNQEDQNVCQAQGACRRRARGRHRLW